MKFPLSNFVLSNYLGKAKRQMMAELRITTPRNRRASMAGTIDPSRGAVRTRGGLIAPEFTFLQFAIADHHRARHRYGRQAA
jgi:hypothetical protein